MKKYHGILLIISLLFLRLFSFSGNDLFSQNSFKQCYSLQAPSFSTGTRIQANGTDLKVDTYASVPCVVDWNADGKKDLLVGCFYNGNVYLYLNSGTNSSPIFTTGSKLQANGSDISVAYG